MAEFQKVMKDKKLMCDHFHSEQNGCSRDCPMIKANFNCTKQILEQAHDEEIIIEDWAKKNPVITNGDKFKEVFGRESHTTCYAEGITFNNCTAKCDAACPYYADAEYHAPEGSEK